MTVQDLGILCSAFDICTSSTIRVEDNYAMNRGFGSSEGFRTRFLDIVYLQTDHMHEHHTRKNQGSQNAPVPTL